jgi:type IV pilus assembly protein PilY1
MFNSSSHKEKILMWEFTNADDEDLGLTFNSSPTRLVNGQAKQIVKFQNGRWGVVIGNGYNSTPATYPGKAVLYVLFLSGPSGSGTPKTWTDEGVDYVKIVADNGPDNGLSTPIPYDTNGDGLADTVYAGDLKGNLWKFDLSNELADEWIVANSGAALFSAGKTKPITTPPEIALHPDGGRIVMFGTGRYLVTGDNDSDLAQSFYGIRDTGSIVTAADLVEQVVTVTTINGNTYRVIGPGCGPSEDPPNLCPDPDKGWYINLPTLKERATGSPKLAGAKIFFNTFIPSDSACDFGGTGWLMAIDYRDGSVPEDRTFDTNNSGSINTTDTPVAGAQIGAALGGTTLIKGSASAAAIAAAEAGAAAALAAASDAGAAAAAAAIAAGASESAAAAAGAAAAAATASGEGARAVGAAAAAAAIDEGATEEQAAAASAAASAAISSAYSTAASEAVQGAISADSAASVSSTTDGGIKQGVVKFGSGWVGRINWREIIE